MNIAVLSFSFDYLQATFLNTNLDPMGDDSDHSQYCSSYSVTYYPLPEIGLAELVLCVHSYLFMVFLSVLPLITVWVSIKQLIKEIVV